MANPDNIVTVNITVQDASVTQAGFGTPMIITHEDAFGPELVRSYSSITAMTTDGHSAAGATVLAATAILAQNPKVPTLKVGRRAGTATAMTRIMTVAVANDTTLYTVTINGTAFTMTSDASATVEEIALGLDAAINAGAVPVTSTDNLDGTFDLVEDVVGAVFGLSHDVGQITQDDTTAEGGIAADYAAIKAEDNDFYGVAMTSSATLEIAALATAVGADVKIFIAQSADSDILLDTAGNINETLNTAGHTRTALIFNQDNLDFANFAWMGRQLPKDPGSSTWAFKDLTGVAVDVLSDTQITNIEASEGNHFTATKGLRMTINGTMASGRFIDITHGIDWLTVRMQERILQLLANSDKIAYTQAGITALENEVRAQLQEAVGQNVITTGFTVTSPAIGDVSSTDKANRILGNLDFSAILAGAIQEITVNGSVSV